MSDESIQADRGPAEVKLHTTEDYEQLPKGSPYQLIGGHLVMTPAPSVAHQRISRKLGFILNQFVAQKDRQNIIGEMKIMGPPDLVIEILSPSTGYYDRREKRDVYEQTGVREYWIVDPQRREVEIFINHNPSFELLTQGGPNQAITSRVLAGLTFDPASIF